MRRDLCQWRMGASAWAEEGHYLGDRDIVLDVVYRVIDEFGDVAGIESDGGSVTVRRSLTGKCRDGYEKFD
eukprot:gene1707-5694_t